MSESGVLNAGWSMAANDEARLAADPESIALICASRLGHGFRILAAPGCTVALARDARGVFHVGVRR